MKKNAGNSASILRAQEVEKKIDNLLGSSPVHSTFLPMGYCSLADSMRPIEPIIDQPLTTHSPGQISTPITSYVVSVPNPPRYFASGAQPSIPVSSVPLNVGWQPSTRPTLFDTRVVPSQGHTSNIETSTVFVPPTHTNVVNPPSSSGQPLGAQPVTIQSSSGYGYQIM